MNVVPKMRMWEFGADCSLRPIPFKCVVSGRLLGTEVLSMTLTSSGKIRFVFLLP